MMPGRPTVDQTMMEVAHVLAERSTCWKRDVGCVITRDNRIVSSGYNGAPSGMYHCKDSFAGCLIDPYTQRCTRSIHAETNAIITASRHGVPLDGGTAYVTCRPCLPCLQNLIQAGIARVVADDMRTESSDAETMRGYLLDAPVVMEYFKK